MFICNYIFWIILCLKRCKEAIYITVTQCYKDHMSSSHLIKCYTVHLSVYTKSVFLEANIYTNADQKVVSIQLLIIFLYKAHMYFKNSFCCIPLLRCLSLQIFTQTFISVNISLIMTSL